MKHSTRECYSFVLFSPDSNCQSSSKLPGSFEAKSELSSTQPSPELLIWYRGSEAKHLNNQNRYCMFPLKKPSNRKFNIARTSHVFKETTCRWLGAVHACYVLKSRSLNDCFEVFNTNDIMDTISKSNEDEAEEHCEQNCVDANEVNMKKYLSTLWHFWIMVG